MKYDPSRDYYHILQVIPTADPRVIAFTYKALQSLFHPDMRGGSTEKSQLLNEAFEVLGDATRRAEYDHARKEYIALHGPPDPDAIRNMPRATAATSPPPPREPRPTPITFADLARADLIEKEVILEGMIASVDPTVYNCPSCVAFWDKDDEGIPFELRYFFQPRDEVYISAATGRGNALERAAKVLTVLFHHDHPFRARELRVVESVTVRRLVLSTRPIGVFVDGDGAGHQSVEVYLIGSSRVSPGDDLRVRGFVKRHPATNATTILATSAERLTPRIEQFKITTPMRAGFEMWAKSGYWAVVDQVKQSITHVVGRDALTVLALLTLHSPTKFTTKSLVVDRGWLEIGVLGDAGQAKSATARRILQAIGLGTYAVASTATRTGLCYTYTDGNKSIRWGLLPANDRGLVVLDEVQEMDERLREQLNSVRSEGVVDTSGILPGRVFARTRIMWIFNPPGGKAMDVYSQPAEALAELFNPTFIRRLDLVIGVQAHDDPAQVVRSRREAQLTKSASTAPTWLTPALLRDHVLWVWSRKPDQVVFDDAAEAAVFDHAEELAGVYGHARAIPLCNAADLPEKLARLAASMAALRHSANRDHETIVVKASHVVEAAIWVKVLYRTGNGLDLERFAARERGHAAMTDEELSSLVRWVSSNIEGERVKRPGAKAKSTTRALLRYLFDHEEANAAALAEVAGLSATGLRKKMKEYVDRELVERVRPGTYQRTRRLRRLLEELRAQALA